MEHFYHSQSETTPPPHINQDLEVTTTLSPDASSHVTAVENLGSAGLVYRLPVPAELTGPETDGSDREVRFSDDWEKQASLADTYVSGMADRHPLEKIYIGNKRATAVEKLRPADVAGRLELESYLINHEAKNYDPDSPIGQRLQLAAMVRESAQKLVELNNNDPKLALKYLKRERKEAIRSGSTLRAENIEREIMVIKRTNSMSYMGEIDALWELTYGNRDPQFSEKGLVRQLGSIVRKVVTGSSLTGFNNQVTENLRSNKAQKAHRGLVADSIIRRNEEVKQTKVLDQRTAVKYTDFPQPHPSVYGGENYVSDVFHPEDDEEYYGGDNAPIAYIDASRDMIEDERRRLEQENGQN